MSSRAPACRVLRALMLALLLVAGIAEAEPALDVERALDEVRTTVRAAGVDVSVDREGRRIATSVADGEVEAAVVQGGITLALAPDVAPPLVIAAPVPIDVLAGQPLLLPTGLEPLPEEPAADDAQRRRGARGFAAIGVERPRGEGSEDDAVLLTAASIAPSPPETRPDGAAVAGLALGVTALAALLGRLYSRFQRHTLLLSKARARVHDHVVANPGATIAELARATGLGRGALVHHAQMLEKHGLLRSRHDGLHRRFWPPGAPELPQRPLTEKEQRLVELLREAGQLPQAEIARRLGVSRQAVHQQIERLRRDGRLPE